MFLNIHFIKNWKQMSHVGHRNITIEKVLIGINFWCELRYNQRQCTHAIICFLFLIITKIKINLCQCANWNGNINKQMDQNYHGMFSFVSSRKYQRQRWKYSRQYSNCIHNFTCFKIISKRQCIDDDTMLHFNSISY